MGRGIIASLLVLVACSGPGTLEERGPEAYLLVAEDLLGRDAPGRFCVSPWLGFSEELHPPEVLAALKNAGYPLLGGGTDQGTLPSLEDQVLTLYPLREDSLGIQVRAAVWTLRVSRGALEVGETHWEYRVACQGRGCQLLGRTGPEYVDGSFDPGQLEVEAVLAGGGVKCGGGQP